MFGLRLARTSTETARVEAFSDGVLAIAITLLVLEVRLPEVEGESVGSALRHAWPQYVAYVTAFLTIAVMWANHHDLFKLIDHADRGLMALNALLLLTISFLPFPTSVLADHMTQADDDRQAALLAYGGTMVAIAGAYNLLWRYICSRGLLRDDVPAEVVRAVSRGYNPALVLYAAALALSFFTAWLSIAVWVALALFFMFFAYETQPSR